MLTKLGGFYYYQIKSSKPPWFYNVELVTICSTSSYYTVSSLCFLTNVLASAAAAETLCERIARRVLKLKHDQ